MPEALGPNFSYFCSMSRFRAIFFLLVLSNSCFGQEAAQSVNYRLNVTRFDFFTGLEYTKRIQSFQPFAALEFGINRSIFQQRFFPKMAVGLSYDLVRNEQWMLGPSLQTSYSLLKVNRSTNHFHQWNELMIGLRLETGKKWKYICLAEYGLVVETYFDQVTKKNERIGSYGYVLSMGFGYAW